MSWHIVAAAASLVVSILGVYPYVRDMLGGTTRPNIVTWGVWFLIQGIFLSAQFASGASWSAVLPLAQMFTAGLVVLLGLVGYGYKKYSLLDGVCFLLAIGALVLWQITSNPLLALVFSVVADATAATPTLVKSYFDPASETASSYLLVVLSAIFALLSTSLYDIPNILWPCYMIFISGTIASILLLRGPSLRPTTAP